MRSERVDIVRRKQALREQARRGRRQPVLAQGVPVQRVQVRRDDLWVIPSVRAQGAEQRQVVREFGVWVQEGLKGIIVEFGARQRMGLQAKDLVRRLIEMVGVSVQDERARRRRAPLFERQWIVFVGIELLGVRHKDAGARHGGAREPSCF